MKKLVRIFRKETGKILQVFLNPTFIYLTLIGNLILLFATGLVYQLEKGTNPKMRSYFDSLWWGVSTITTVGYGDILPQTFAGRVIGIGLMYTGTVLFISFTGILLTNLLKEEVEEEILPLQNEILLEEKNQEKIELLLRNISERLERLEEKIPKKFEKK